MSPTELHPRSATEIIDAAFRLLGQHYARLAAISVTVMLPLIITRIFIPVETPLENFRLYMAVIGVTFTCSSLAEAATVIAVSDSYLTGSVDIAGALAATLSRILWVLVLALVRLLLVIVAAFALLFPGLYVWLRTFAAMPALLLERLSPADAIGRSWRLADGSMWKVTGTLFLAFLIFYVLFIVLAMLAGVVSALFGFRGSPALGALESVLSALLYPVVSVVITLLYYDLRIRREGFDLEIMAKELG